MRAARAAAAAAARAAARPAAAEVQAPLQMPEAERTLQTQSGQLQPGLRVQQQLQYRRLPVAQTPLCLARRYGPMRRMQPSSRLRLHPKLHQQRQRSLRRWLQMSWRVLPCPQQWW